MLEAQEQKLQNGFAFFFPKERQCFYTFRYGTQCDQLRTLEARIHCKVPINIRQINFVCFFFILRKLPNPFFSRLQQPMIVKYYKKYKYE